MVFERLQELVSVMEIQMFSVGYEFTIYLFEINFMFQMVKNQFRKG
jgi:hypothetical protein